MENRNISALYCSMPSQILVRKAIIPVLMEVAHDYEIQLLRNWGLSTKWWMQQIVLICFIVFQFMQISFYIYPNIKWIKHNISTIPGKSLAGVRAKITPWRPPADGAAFVGAGQRLPLPRAPQPTRSPPAPPHAARCWGGQLRGRGTFPSSLGSLPRSWRRQETIQPRLQVPQHQLL